ncbi:HupE/UreJ family protein [Paenibacillus sp. GCM10027628]|uniref:HupE/UreJ family protein n=1 Tax=Paenibacillus sp. GCM10027628 TaxID=3273413 RepID=UPI0036345870
MLQYGVVLKGKKIFLALALAVSMYTIFAGSAWAHFSSTGYSDMKVGPDALQYHLTFSEHDLLQLLSGKGSEGDKISDKQLSDSLDAISKLVDDGLIVTGDGKVGTGVIVSAKHEKRASMDMVGMDIRYKFASPVKKLLVQYNFFWYNGVDPNHRNYATIHVGGQTIEQVLGSQNYIVQIQGPAAIGQDTGIQAKPADSSWLATLQQYIWMGMEHIWTGIDHMLFLVGLLLASDQRVWKIVKLISAFTIGHCITLVLSSLEIAYLSPKIVEPLIALSILYIAVENIWRKKESGRLVVTMLFGLVHGFGFAEVLRGTLSGNMALPLFSFNLGVEIGQLVIMAVFIPALWAVRRIPMKINWSLYASGIIGVFGLYWLIERVIAQ